MRKLILLVLILCSNTLAAITDIKFGQYQIADSQWNVSACLYTTTCEIYYKNPGVMYKIPWWNGQWNWQAGQYNVPKKLNKYSAEETIILTHL